MLVPKLVVVDFDGTLCDFNYPGIGAVKEGARETLLLLRQLGYRIMISSCRSCSFYPEIFSPDNGKMGSEATGHKAMVAWLDANNLAYDEVDDGTKGKPMADFYVDDKGIRFSDNWKEIGEFIAART